MFVPYFWELGLHYYTTTTTILSELTFQFGPPPYLGASVPLAYSPYLTSGLVSPLLGSEQQLQHHGQAGQQPQPHLQQNIQNKQRPERIEVSQISDSAQRALRPQIESTQARQTNNRTKPGGLSHHTKLYKSINLHQLSPLYLSDCVLTPHSEEIFISTGDDSLRPTEDRWYSTVTNLCFMVIGHLPSTSLAAVHAFSLSLLLIAQFRESGGTSS